MAFKKIRLKTLTFTILLGALMFSLNAVVTQANQELGVATIEWISDDVGGENNLVVINEQSCANSHYSLTVREMIQKNHLCYRGNSNQVIQRVFFYCFKNTSSESCKNSVASENRIDIGPCHREKTDSEYSLTIAPCSK